MEGVRRVRGLCVSGALGKVGSVALNGFPSPSRTGKALLLTFPPSFNNLSSEGTAMGAVLRKTYPVNRCPLSTDVRSGESVAIVANLVSSKGAFASVLRDQ
jgi:hypothetical protein